LYPVFFCISLLLNSCVYIYNNNQQR
jgi:hypothetical protein